MDKLCFARASKDVHLPSKRAEDAGYDIYPYFAEDYLVIKPQQTCLVATGLYSAFEAGYVMILKERGSTGVKGVAQRAGVVDSGYRGEIMIPLTNTNDKPLVITKTTESFSGDDYIILDYAKAIAQAIVVALPELEVCEIKLKELQGMASVRGEGRLGSSGK